VIRSTDLARTWSAASRTFLDLVLPRYCVGCGAGNPAEPWQFLCPDCRAGLELVEAPFCPVCGYPYDGVDGPSLPACVKCFQHVHQFGCCRSLFLLQGPGSVLIRVLKYREGHYLQPDLEYLLRRDWSLEPFFDGARIVPVPLHPRREKQRGYNQSELIARAIVGVYPGARLAPILDRVRMTSTQTHLDRVEREKNVRGAFALKEAAEVSGEIRHVLVDDVFTTGSTLDACAAALRREGIRRVDAFTLAHG